MNALQQQQALFEIDRALLFKAADRSRTSFRTFFSNFAWPVLEPSTRFISNWHIDAMCEHLQAITQAQLTRLIISVPFRMLKSTCVSQAWNAWEWIETPHTQWLTASYARDLAVRDAVNTRRIIESVAYRECFGDRYRLTTDQNVKSRYENSARGMRVTTSTDSAATGFGGNRIIVDDPISALDADSEIARKASIEWFKGTISTRFNNPAEDACVVVHQRLHQDDLTGYLLKEQSDMWEHLVLPMRYSKKRQVMVSGVLKTVDADTIKTSIGWSDPRTEEGELLCEARLDDVAVKVLEKSLGEYHTAAQLQQDPSSRGGTIFKREDWRLYTQLPARFDEIIISVDCSFKDTKSSDYVAIQKWGRIGADKYLIKRIRERMGFSATCQAIRTEHASTSNVTAVLIEDKANGPAVIETIRKDVAGIIAIDPEGGKVARAYAIQPEQEAGNIYLPDPSLDATIGEYLNEVSAFPNVAHDDETDATTQAINWFKNRTNTTGVLDFYEQKLRALQAAKEQAK